MHMGGLIKEPLFTIYKNIFNLSAHWHSLILLSSFDIYVYIYITAYSSCKEKKLMRISRMQLLYNDIFLRSKLVNPNLYKTEAYRNVY